MTNPRYPANPKPAAPFANKSNAKWLLVDYTPFAKESHRDVMIALRKRVNSHGFVDHFPVYDHELIWC